MHQEAGEKEGGIGPIFIKNSKLITYFFLINVEVITRAAAQGSQQSKMLKQGFFSVHKKRIIINLHLFMESDITYCPLPHPPL